MRRRVAWAVASLVVVALVAVIVVRNRPPDPVQVQANADLAYEITVGTAVETMSIFAELHPDVPFVPPERSGNDADWWLECAGGHFDGVRPPEAITWTSIRALWAEPKRETASLLPELITALERDGWKIGSDFTDDFSRSIDMSRSGFTLHVYGVVAATDEHASAVAVRVTSPCVYAPADQEDWEWRPGPTEPPWADERPDLSIRT